MQKTNKFIYTIAVIFAAIVFIFSSVWGGGAAYVHAATSTTVAFDKTDVLEDLQSSEDFNILKYPYDSTGLIRKPEIISVVEYCYSFRPGARGNYGVYIYFYNPQAINIVTDGIQNKITMATAWKEVIVDGKTSLQATDYEKFELQYCGKTTGDYRDLFYKFKVVDHMSADGKTIAERVNSNARRYDISEVELVTYGERNATAYGVGASFVYTGYAAGYGADSEAESTLKWERAEIRETIELDISGKTDGIDKRTYWRSDSVSSLGKGHQNQINSVYFAIDNSVLAQYGSVLQRIKAEWWEYKTVPSLVVNNSKIVNKLLTYAGNDIGDSYDASREYSVYHRSTGYSEIGHYYFCDSYWNVEHTPVSVFGDTYSRVNPINQLPLIFDTKGVSIFDYEVSAGVVQNYCEEYAASFNNGKVDIGHGRTLSADLFDDTVDEGHIRGYNCREFDISNPDDYYNLKSYDSANNGFDKWLDYGWGAVFGSIDTSTEYLDTPPIEEVTPSHIASSNISNDLKINSADIEVFKQFYKDSVSDNKTVFIFHYLFCDYYAEDADIYDISADNRLRDIAEYRTSTQIFDFDILTMTFNKNGELTTFGVVR